MSGVVAEGGGEEEALADGHVGHHHRLGAGALQEEPLDREGGAYALGVGPGHAEPGDAILGGQARDLVREGDEGGAVDDRIGLAALRGAPRRREPRGGEPRVASDHDEGLHRLEGQLGVEVVAGRAHVVLEELAQVGVRYARAAHLLVDPHRADPQGMGPRHAPAAQQHDFGRSAAHLEDEGVRARQYLALVLEGVLDAEVHEVVLLDVLDDGDLEARLERDAVDEGVPVLRFAEGARRDDAGVLGRESVAADKLAEGGEDGHALAHGLAAHHARREHVAAYAALLARAVEDLEAARARRPPRRRGVIPVEPISMTATTLGLVMAVPSGADG